MEEPPDLRGWWTLPGIVPFQNPQARPSPNHPYHQSTLTTARLLDEQEDALSITRMSQEQGSAWGRGNGPIPGGIQALGYRIWGWFKYP